MTRVLDRNDARKLLFEGQLALSQVEANGMLIDVPYLTRMIDETGAKLKEYEHELKADPIWATWKKVYGDGANLASGPQLGHVIFDLMGVPCNSRTASGIPSTDAENLEAVDLPWIRRYLLHGKLEDARTKNLLGILEETVNGILRPHFSLNTVISYRSSSSSPNAQNFPNRDDKVAKLVRRAFIPRPGHVLLEIDMKSAEVCVSACYHHDPTMIDYIHRGHDYHMDLACQCYKLERSQVPKSVRGVAKGNFVFASFYGDWWRQIARNLWKAVERDRLTRKDGVGLREHLAQQGITELGSGEGRDPSPGTFEAHIKDVYDDFWDRRFAVYSQWKVDWWNEYCKNGFCRSHTGFTYRGIHKRNEILNYPIQGASFHCLLWSLIRLNEWMVSHGMRSMIIGQIHDSIILDVHESELPDVLAMAHRIMITDIRREWPWIVVPLDVEASLGRENWYSKEEVKLVAA